MASDHDTDRDDAGPASPAGSISRRQVLTAGLAAVGAGSASLAAAPAAAGRPVAVAQPGTTAAEFRVRVAQTGAAGEQFTAYGYLTAADGTTDADLFLG